ncbi:MAG: PIG-L family deacetylase [Rhodanobacter sp.]|nr:MAG: PIG-L family deacetylase [Rhodanobacter sp.]TAM14677.1 MAG: PIG-L family deacetylase [Rhodanobacter sp.]TAM37469.1 MAG: PIG-L family deacetylase [Rhodanobacter sp.]
MALNANGATRPIFSPRTRLLVVAPHPDDETLANGVLLQQVLAAGGTVGVLLLTAGENNPWPQRWLERRWRIDPAAQARWAQRRRHELDAALRELAVPTDTLECLAWPDLGVLDRVLRPELGAVAQLRAVLARFAPDVIALPALADRHPDHGAAHVLTRMAIAAWGDTPTLLEYLIHGVDADARAVAADATPAQRAAKQRAVAAHHSQLVLSRRRLRRWGERTEQHAVHAVPPRVDGLLPWHPSAVVRAKACLTAVTVRGDVGRWRWREAPLVWTGTDWRLAWPHAAAADTCFVRLSLDWPSPWIFDRWGWREIRGASTQLASRMWSD